MTISSIQSKIVFALKVFLMGMVRQFLAHTIITYGLKLPSSLSFIWVWKEAIIWVLWVILVWFFIKNKEYRQSLLSHKLFVFIAISIIISIGISLVNSLWIHHQSLIEFAVSAKFNYIPLIIFIVGVGVSHLLTKQQNESLINTALLTIKWVLIFSLFRYGILHTIPNILDRIGFSQPGMSIERTAWTPPPSLYLTEFYSGYIRNQWPFGWPLSLWFYLVALWPLFYAFQLYKKKFSDVWWRWVLYLGIVISTYSRAAQWIFIISSIFLLLIVYRKYTKYIISLWIATVIAIIIYITGGGKSELFLRTWSDKWHLEYFFQWLELVKQNRLRGLWAASVWPWSNHVSSVGQIFNPENQYMQIWLEYGLFGVITWIISYIAIALNPLQQWINSWTDKLKRNISKEYIAYMWIWISILSLSIAGMVLHPFVDSSSAYPFMLISGILFWSYHLYFSNQKYEVVRLTKKERKQELKNISSENNTINSNNTQINPIKRNFLSLMPYIWTIVMAIFFILQTFLSFWIHVIDNTIVLSTIRDVFFGISISISILRWWKHILPFLLRYRLQIISILTIIIVNIVYYITYTGDKLSIIAGIKYDIFHFIIIGAGLWLWYLIYVYKKWSELSTYIQRFLRISIGIIILGVIRQLAKNIVPDVFLSYIGYSSPSDFVPYDKPPIYYITWAWGIERLSWLFVWPNTLGFFLILMTSVLYFYIKNSIKKKYILIGSFIYIIISLLTLSRWAIVGISLQILLLIGYEAYIVGGKTFSESNKLFFTKKIPVIILTIISTIIALFSINLWKQDSNSERINSWETITKILNQRIPLLWYGPWYVWPARHYTTNYKDDQKNDYAMLENIYLQTLINQGRLWFILFLTVFSSLYYIHYTILQYLSFYKNSNNLYILKITQYMGLWLLWLLFIGSFLHIFIDSMVTYLFLLPYAILIWYSYSSITTKEPHIQ